MSAYHLTVGPCGDGRKLAIISTGGHPKINPAHQCVVLAVEIVDGWGRRKISDWFNRMVDQKPWETRQ